MSLLIFGPLLSLILNRSVIRTNDDTLLRFCILLKHLVDPSSANQHTEKKDMQWEGDETVVGSEFRLLII